MPFTDNPGCAHCDCPIMIASTSPPDAAWRKCACRCHDSARTFTNIGPTKETK